MSATGTKPKPSEPSLTTKLPYYQINPSYTVRVICCVIFIFLTEICLAHYIYRLIKSEINEDFVSKREFNQHFLNELRSGIAKEEIQRILRELQFFEHQNARNSSRRKRDALVVDDDNLLNLPNDGPNVEFFHPNLRGELEAKDELETGNKGAAPGGDSWVWLTSYCRIPMLAIQGFCSATKEYCPVGPPGPDGPKGNPGMKGDRGDTGFPGIPGPIGPRGYQGNEGVKGVQGRPGLDGRDGVPGEPGFDGIPGRNGYDGRPGVNGTEGASGKDGRDGIDGRPGMMGPQGPPGPQGPTGLTGPRGRPGKPGNHGTPGIPGITAWKTRVNGTDLLIPPSIAGNTYGSSRDPIIVYEGENVRLRCAASGIPKPNVEWRRTDGQLIFTGVHRDVSISGDNLNLTHINRVHMGTYQCIANNGVPPQSNHTFTLEVHFPPLIRIRNQMVGAVIGSFAILECEVEAFPESVRYWERTDGRLLESGAKYQIHNNDERVGYKAKMILNITRINSHDLTMYHCISKNERGITKGAFTVYEIDPGLATPPPILDGSNVAVFGVQPPEVVSLEQLCPPPPKCDNKCTEFRNVSRTCVGSGFLFDLLYRWEVRKFGDEIYPGYNKRGLDCELYAVGKPVYHGFYNQSHGSWMRDSQPATDFEGEKFWITNESDPTSLYEYANKSEFRKNAPTKHYKLDFSFQGNAHVVYNGSFYYHAKGQPKIIRFLLNNSTNRILNISKFIGNDSNTLYTTKYNYLDFNVDDNGLWVIFPVPDSNNTAVMKVNVSTMQVQWIWNISLNHHNVGEMFVVCGVLYAIDSVEDRNSKIRFALDLYNSKLLDVNLSFTNPFRKTTMVGYNHRNKELYSWDKGNQLAYPVLYNEMGNSNSTSRES